MGYHKMSQISSQGDPFLHKRLGGAISGGLRNILGGPGAVIRGSARGFSRGGRPSATAVAMPGSGFSFKGYVDELASGGRTRKRRRINYGNTKALKRAAMRTEGFVKLAKVALKDTGYKVVSKSADAASKARARAQKDRHHSK